MICRRGFLKAFGLGAVLISAGMGRAVASHPAERILNLYNIHTGERLRTTYFSEGEYKEASLKDLYRLLRCHYNDEVFPIDTGVLDLLHGVTEKTGWKGEVAVISGFRSRAYNDHLLGIGRGVAKDSLHLHGKAIDFSLKGVGTTTLAGIARSFLAGGVGRYAGFVHIDVGRIRYW